MDTREDTVAAAESTLLTNASQIESTITQLCEMGFPRDDVVKVLFLVVVLVCCVGFSHLLLLQALRAAFNNPNRAVEYLMSGHIPDVGPAPAPGAGRQPPAPAGGGGGGGGGAPAGAAGGGNPLNLFEAADRARQPGGGAGGAAGGGEGFCLFLWKHIFVF